MNKRFIMKIGEQFLIISSLHLILSVYFKSVITPSFFLIWLLVLTWDGNTELALLLAFITGIIYDAMIHGTMGSTSLYFLFLVYINSFLKLKKSLPKFINVIFFSIIFFIFLLFEPTKGFLWNFWPRVKYSILFSLYNGIVFLFFELSLRKYRWRQKNDYLGIL